MRGRVAAWVLAGTLLAAFSFAVLSAFESGTAYGQPNATGPTGPDMSPSPTITFTPSPTITFTPSPAVTSTSTPEPVPFINQIDPPFGSTAGGTNVTISGTGFVSGLTVSIGGSVATNVVVVNSSTITATTPSHAAGVVEVVVTNSNTRSGTAPSAFKYVAAPTITAMDPSSGMTTGGEFVLLTGTNLGSVVGVDFGGTAGFVYGGSDTSLYVRTPARAAGPVAVTIKNSVDTTATAPTQFTFIDPATSTAIAQFTANAKASETAIALETQTAYTNAVYAAATATASQSGRSQSTAIQLPVGASDSRTVASSTDMIWYSIAVEAGQVYRVSNTCTGAEANNAIYLWQIQDNQPVNIAVKDTSCGITFTAPATSTMYVSTSGQSGTSYTMQLAQTGTVADTPTITPVIPTTTSTITPTPSATEKPATTGDQHENDDNFSAATPITVGDAGAQTHTFHSALDLDHVKFTASSQGAYVVRTSDLAGGAQTIITILDSGTGAVVPDPITGLLMTAFADTVTTGAAVGQARITLSVFGSNVGRTFAVRITNASPDNYGTGTSYKVRVTREDFTPTPTPVPAAPTRTSTATATPTRTPAAGDAYESDNTKASADASPYSLLKPISHTGTQTLSTDRQTGPAHTFHAQGDEDWLAIGLPAIVSNSQLVVRAYDVTRRGEQRTQPQVFLYRTNPGTGALQLLRRVENCTDVSGQASGSCLTMNFPPGQATLYSGQTLYLRIRNLTSTFYGSDVGYSLEVKLNAPASITTTPTRTPSPSASGQSSSLMDRDAGLLLDGGSANQSQLVQSGPTSTTTPTARPVEQLVNPGRGGRYTTGNGDTDGEAPRYFTSGYSDGVDLSFRSSSPLTQGGRLRIVTADALDTNSGDPITQFLLPFGFCVRYTLADLDAARVTESTLAPSYLDPLSGERRTDGVVRTSFTSAQTAPNGIGEMCFKTTHFTEFEIEGDELPPPTVAPTMTRTPTPAPPPVFNTPIPTPTQRPASQPTATPTFAPVSTTISTGGATVSTSNGALSVAIPSGAISGSARLDISTASAPRTAAGVNIGIRAVQINLTTPDGTPITTLAQPMQLTMSYDEDELRAAGLTDIGLQIVYSNDGVTWRPLATQIDRQNRRVIALVDHLTIFSLTAPRSRVLIPAGVRNGGW